MRKIALGLLCLTLSACATTEKYEAVLRSWVGHNEDELISSWGPPTGVYESGNNKYLTYQNSNSGYVPGVAPTYQTTLIGNTLYTNAIGGSPGYSYTNHCKTTFTVTNNVIQSWRWEGNSCKSE